MSARVWRRTLRAGALLLTGLSLRCGGADSASSAGSDANALAAWTLSPEPLAQIGVVQGDAAQQLATVVASKRLSDGRIVVLDGGSRELRFFSAEGAHLSSAGGRGQGPGQFRFPNRLWRGAGDTLRVFDVASDRISVFTPDGSFVRTEDQRPVPSADSAAADPFTMDEWIFGWNWIDSPLLPAERGGLVEALAALPPADTAAPMRRIRVTEDGLLWVAGVGATADSGAEWQVHRPDGRLIATLEMPGRFTPSDIGFDYILGTYKDALDVEFVRLYALDRAGSPAGPGLAAFRGHGPAVYPPMPEDAVHEVRAALRNLASRQELYYSNHYSYASVIDSLHVPAEQMPASVRAELVSGDDRGWTGAFLHRPTGAICVLASGGGAPPGWSSGRVICPGT